MSFIGDDPNNNLLENSEELRNRMELSGFTYVRTVTTGENEQTEQIVFRSKNGTEVIISENSLTYGGGADGVSAEIVGDPTTPENIKKAIDLAAAAKASFGDNDIFFNSPADDPYSQKTMAVNAYVAQLSGINSPSLKDVKIPDDIKAQVDKVWQEMYPDKTPQAPDPTLSQRPVPIAPSVMPQPTPP